MGIPNLKQWVSPWRQLQTKTLSVAERDIELDVDFTSDVIYKLYGICASNGGLVQPVLVVNSDTGDNYEYRVISMDATGAYNETVDATANSAPIGPGFTSSGGISTGEQVIVDCTIVYKGGVLLIATSAYTNGSLEGDHHRLIAVWTGTPETISLRSDAHTGGILPISSFDAFAVGTRFDLYALNNAEVFETS